jgi:hypothetical protein
MAPGVHFYTRKRSPASHMIVTAQQIRHSAD